MPYYSSFDFNVILLWVMAIGTFIMAGIWAGNDSFGTEHSYLQAQDDSEVVTRKNFHAKQIQIAQCSQWLDSRTASSQALAASVA